MSQPALDLGEEPLDDPANPTYTVAELADALNASLRRGFSDGVWVRGEIQGWNERGQHAYFNLADDSAGVKAVLRVQFFANARMKLRPMLQKHRLRLVDGMKVRVFGYLDFYAPAGQLGLKMADLDPRFTLGDLAAQRDEVIRRLVAEGLLDANKRTISSPIPLRVGVVSSVNTAAWHDFHDELVRSHFGFHLCVCDVRVQGPTAARGISRAITALATRRDLDAIVVIRGGGARNELATFDAESIARAIAASRVPVFTGLGHEVDRSVADEAAHTAFKTPTACAASLVDSVRAYMEASERSWSAITALSHRQLGGATEQLTGRAHRIARRTHDAVERAEERLATRVDTVRTRAPRALTVARSRVDDIAARVVRRPHQLLAAEDRHLASLQARLGLLDPANLLARGWSITRTDDGRIVRSVGAAPPGAIIHTEVGDGTLTSRVERPSRVEDPSR
jgi:exodeoxyribonuclease VII large subunit